MTDFVYGAVIIYLTKRPVDRKGATHIIVLKVEESGSVTIFIDVRGLKVTDPRGSGTQIFLRCSSVAVVFGSVFFAFWICYLFGWIQSGFGSTALVIIPIRFKVRPMKEYRSF